MTTLEKPTRRNFLTGILAGWSALLFLPVIYGVVQYIIPPKIREQLMENILVGKISDVPANDAKIVKVNKKAIVLLKTDQGQVKAFSAVCTHLGCIVQYQSDRKVFHCNCHGSEFDTNGKNIAGPAPSPLQPYRVELKNDDVIISQI